MAAIVIDPVHQERLAAILAMPELPAPEQRTSFRLEQLLPGGYLSIGGDVYRAEQRYRYNEDGYDWYELKLYSLSDGSTRFLEWEIDDELEVWLAAERFSSLDAVELTPAALARIDEEESGQVRWRGKTFRYEESGEAAFYRREGATAETVKYWDFIAESGELLGVEKWSDGYAVSLSHAIAPRSIQILLPDSDG